MVQLSVVIPTYNAGALLARAIASVAADGRADVEIVVVDDGSTDGGASAVAHLPGVRVLRQENRGPGAARNRGVAEARGQLVAFLDADDVWLPGRLGMILAPDRVAGGGPLIAYCDYLLHYIEARITQPVRCRHLDPPAAANLLLRNSISTSTVVARRDALLAAGGFLEDVRYAEDWDLWLRMLERGPSVKLPGIWMRKSNRPGTLGQGDPWYLHRVQQRIIDRAVARRPDLYRRVSDAALTNVDLRTGIRLYRAGAFRDAQHMLLKALAGGCWSPTWKHLLRASLRRFAGDRAGADGGPPTSPARSVPAADNRQETA